MTAEPQEREKESQPLHGFEPGLAEEDPQPNAQAPTAFARNPERELKTKRPWYGWQLLTSDAFFFSLLGLGVGLDSPSNQDTSNTLAEIWLAGYLLGPSLIHLAHGRPGMAPASLAIRVALPVLGLFAGSAAENCQPAQESELGLCSGPGPGVGLLVGAATASALDAGAFAWDNPQADAPETTSFGLAPLCFARSKGCELQAFGSF